MDNFALSHIWAMRLWFFVLALVIVFFHLIPLDTVPRRWAPPDLLVAFTFAWVLRRPDFAPLLSVAVVMLMADLLFQRPPGLLALLVALSSEYLKSRSAGLREAGLAAEWFNVTIVIVGITILYRLILTLALVEQAPLMLNVIQMVLTIAVYPIVVLVTQTIMGVRKPSPGDADAMGNRK